MAFQIISRLLKNLSGLVSWLKEEILHFFHKNKGSIKDPLICLGVISFILFSFASLGIFPSLNPNKNTTNSVPVPQKEILTANVLGFLESQKNFQGTGGEISQDNSTNLSTVQDSALVSSAMPISPWLYFEGSKEITEYEVGAGDTIRTVAASFGISPETVMWANSLSSNSTLKVGQKLVILPISGVLYRVQSGDTLSGIAKKYKGDSARIIAFNELSSDSDITIGDILVIPDGSMPATPKVIIPQIPLANNYFIFPTQGRITQGLHFYNAVDIANQCGTLIYAAAQGEVIKASITSSTSRWANRGGGSYIKILHPNGTTTYYGHVSANFVNQGDNVSQGQIIALVGGNPGTPGAGNSTGCHLHFEVGGAKNPFASYPLGYAFK